MKTDLRPVLAAMVLLAVLAGVYEAAVRWPSLPPAPARRTIVADSAARAGGRVARVLPPPGAAAEQTENEEAENEEPPRPPCWPQPLRFVEKSRAGSRRFVGTVGGEQATVEIYPSGPDSLRGRFYLWHSGQEYAFSQIQRHRPQVWRLGPAYQPVGGRWLLRGNLPQGQPRAVLQGTWVEAAGQSPRPFLLRESYQDAVRYEVHRLTLSGGRPLSHDSCDIPVSCHEFLHLLGPAAQPQLSRIQCLGRASRRRQLMADHNVETRTEHWLAVKLNDFKLLSYQLKNMDSPFEGSSSFGEVNTLIDLVSGQEITLTSQLQPNYELPLRHLLARRLLARGVLSEDDFGEISPDSSNWEQLYDHGRRVRLPPLPHCEDCVESSGTWALSVQGLQIGTSSHRYLVTIPYRELRPLVRPGTPLARMLQARGLW